ncbi:hypothetical protein AB9F42_34280, partial [Rhizobium leguminosarum]
GVKLEAFTTSGGLGTMCDTILGKIDNLATATESKPETWLDMVERDGHGILDEERLGFEEKSDELLLMGLRLREGVDLARWQQLSGRDLDPK